MQLQENADGSFTVVPIAPLAMADDHHSALFLEALPVLLANAAAMRAVGERTVGVPRGPVLPRVDRDTLPEDVAQALSNAAAAGDAARARAMLACVCRDAQGAADAAFPASQRQGDAARAVACSGIVAALQRRSTELLAHVAPALQRLCAAAGPPAIEPADAWQQFSRRVQTAAELLPEGAPPGLHDDSDDDDWNPEIPQLIEDLDGDDDDDDAPGRLFALYAAPTLLPLIGATTAEVDAAVAELALRTAR
jgi:hypothetical protein